MKSYAIIVDPVVTYFMSIQDNPTSILTIIASYVIQEITADVLPVHPDGIVLPRIVVFLMIETIIVHNGFDGMTTLQCHTNQLPWNQSKYANLMLMGTTNLFRRVHRNIISE
jgi:hypothetical protein